MSDTASTDVTDSAQEVLDTIVSDLSEMSTWLGYIAKFVAALSTAGLVSASTAVTYINLVISALDLISKFISAQETTIISIVGEGEEIYNNIVSYIEDLEDLFSSDSSASLAQVKAIGAKHKKVYAKLKPAAKLKLAL